MRGYTCGKRKKCSSHFPRRNNSNCNIHLSSHQGSLISECFILYICTKTENWSAANTGCEMVKKLLGTIIHQNSQFYHPSEPFSFHHFNVRHPVYSIHSTKNTDNDTNLASKLIVWMNIWIMNVVRVLVVKFAFFGISPCSVCFMIC